MDELKVQKAAKEEEKLEKEKRKTEREVHVQEQFKQLTLKWKREGSIMLETRGRDQE